MDYIAQAQDLAADADQPFNGIVELQPYGYALSLYCAYRATMIDGQLGSASAYGAEYKRQQDQMMTDATARPAYKPPAVGGSP
jgi:hypothetical protein